MNFCRDVTDQVRHSQESMVNPLMLQCSSKCLRDFEEEFAGENEKKKRFFKSPTNEDKLHKMTFKRFTDQSEKKMNLAVGMYVPDQICRADLNLLFTFSPGDLEYALCRFVLEIKKVDGCEYPPNTIREIVIMIQMHLHEQMSKM